MDSIVPATDALERIAENTKYTYLPGGPNADAYRIENATGAISQLVLRVEDRGDGTKRTTFHWRAFEMGAPMHA